MPPIPPLPERMARYERLVAMRDEGLSMQQMAEREGNLTRQQVWNILKAGPPRRPGRPGRSRRDQIIERINRWADRAAAQSEAGRDPGTALARAREARRMLAAIDLEGASPSKRRDMPFGHPATPSDGANAALPIDEECTICRAPLRRVAHPKGGMYYQHDRTAL